MTIVLWIVATLVICKFLADVSSMADSLSKIYTEIHSLSCQVKNLRDELRKQ